MEAEAVNELGQSLVTLLSRIQSALNFTTKDTMELIRNRKNNILADDITFRNRFVRETL